MAITVNNFVYRNLQEQVLYLTDKVGDHATVPANVTFPYGDPEVIYSTTKGATVRGKARLTYDDGGDPADIDIDFTLPVVGDGIDINASADAKQLVIKSNAGGGNILNLDLVNGITVITAAEFEKFKNPELVIWGYYIDPIETDTGKVALRMADYAFNNDTGEEIITFVPEEPSVIRTRLTATHSDSTYLCTITNGYIPAGTVLNFTIDGTPKTASQAPYSWESWVNSPEGAGWFIKTNSNGEQIITDENTEVPTYWVSKDQMENIPVYPTDIIIGGFAYYTV